MFFVLSKVAWWFLTPLHLLVLVQLAGVICLWLKRVSLGKWLLTVATGLIILVTVSPLPEMLLRPLEQRYPALHAVPDRVEGILLLGGAQNVELTRDHGAPQLNDRAETMTEFLWLARKYPEARLVFAGGSGDLADHGLTEADVVKMFLSRQGIEASRLILESRSRNTHENALFARELVQPKQGERWLLLTSAFHMPRSVAVFRKIGWEVIPYPVDYRTLPKGQESGVQMLAKFNLLRIAVHEWIGLAVYRLTGRI